METFSGQFFPCNDNGCNFTILEYCRGHISVRKVVSQPKFAEWKMSLVQWWNKVVLRASLFNNIAVDVSYAAELPYWKVPRKNIGALGFPHQRHSPLDLFRTRGVPCRSHFRRRTNKVLEEVVRLEIYGSHGQRIILTIGGAKRPTYSWACFYWCGQQ